MKNSRLGLRIYDNDLLVTIHSPYRWANKTVNPLQEISDAVECAELLGYSTVGLAMSYRTLDHIRSHYVPEATIERIYASIKELCFVPRIEILDTPMAYCSIYSSRD